MFQKAITYKSSEFFDHFSSHGMIHAFNDMDTVSGVVADTFSSGADVNAMLYWLRIGRPSGHDFGWLHVMVSLEEGYGFAPPFLYKSYMFDLEQTLLRIERQQRKPLGIFL